MERIAKTFHNLFHNVFKIFLKFFPQFFHTYVCISEIFCYIYSTIFSEIFQQFVRILPIYLKIDKISSFNMYIHNCKITLLIMSFYQKWVNFPKLENHCPMQLMKQPLQFPKITTPTLETVLEDAGGSFPTLRNSFS